MFWAYSKFIISLIATILGIGGGFILMLGAFSRKSSAAKWAKRALFFAGLSSFVYGSLILIKFICGTAMTAANIKLIEYYKAFFGGISIGVLITLFLSGELSFKKWRTK
jgi:hypothetical protein